MSSLAGARRPSRRTDSTRRDYPDLAGAVTHERPDPTRPLLPRHGTCRDYPGVGISRISLTSDLCDNLATHKTPVIQAWLARHPRFRLHFTPTGSSWINQVERWFGFLTAQIIRRGVHKSVQALEADIRAWIENWNQNPRPFRWAKTADEILDSLAKYIAKISGAAY